MMWWAWIAVGAILLVSELGFVDAQFYLVFVGASALVVGLLDLAGMLPADWMQWLLFAVLALFSMVVFRRRIYARMRRKLPDMKQGPVGEPSCCRRRCRRARPAGWSTAAAPGARSTAENPRLPPASARESIGSTA